MTDAAYNVDTVEAHLEDTIAQFVYDPYGYVMFAFPWGEPGPLEDQLGPDEWQREQLMMIGETFLDDPETTIQDATASGHGIGKSAETAWIILWAMSTRPNLAGIVTANTQTQLRSKTWRELAVWHKRAINAHWFKWTATRFGHRSHWDTWGMDAIPWSEHNSEAFAGLHERHVLIIYDEASGISDKIWEVTEGAMTTPRAMWFVFGNPTLNTGRFRGCFGKYKHRWTHRQIDARKAKMTNKVKLGEWLQDHGEDSDFFRIRARGEFPRFGSGQLISAEDTTAARNRKLTAEEHVFMNIVIGVDVARYGSDETVICVRQGRKMLEQRVFNGLNNVQVAGRTAETWRKHGSKGSIFVDVVGTGSGVVDVLVDLGYPCIGVNAGERANDDLRFYNKRAEMWWRMKEWYEGSADTLDDPVLSDQASSLEYTYDMKERVKIETKDDLKDRLPELGSPDRADALAFTFAEIVIPQALSESFEPEDRYDE